jgi:hypothetical protein
MSAVTTDSSGPSVETPFGFPLEDADAELAVESLVEEATWVASEASSFSLEPGELVLVDTEADDVGLTAPSVDKPGAATETPPIRHMPSHSVQFHIGWVPDQKRASRTGQDHFCGASGGGSVGDTGEAGKALADGAAHSDAA